MFECVKNACNFSNNVYFLMYFEICNLVTWSSGRTERNLHFLVNMDTEEEQNRVFLHQVQKLIIWINSVYCTVFVLFYVLFVCLFSFVLFCLFVCLFVRLFVCFLIWCEILRTIVVDARSNKRRSFSFSMTV